MPIHCRTKTVSNVLFRRETGWSVDLTISRLNLPQEVSVISRYRDVRTIATYF
jgi:hypothetical protein